MLKGLTDKQVQESRLKYGSNVIEEAEPETFLDKVKGQLGDPMIKLLIAIAIIMGILAVIGYGEWLEVAGIVFSVALVTLISARTELASDSEYRKLKSSVKKETCKVYRHGKVVELEIDDIVVGDCIILQSGDKIPADGFLVDGFIKVDNSSLNGESEECKKFAHEDPNSVELSTWNTSITGDTFVDETSVFRGAVTVDGSAVMKVVRVGMATVMGEMAKEMADNEVDSPLKVKLSDLAHKISTFGYIGAVLIMVALLFSKVMAMGGFGAYFSQDPILIFKQILEVVMLAVVIIVMAVPEGLPLMIAIVLMQNTKKLLDSQVLVRKPIGIETAGSLNILFSDKTGTITKGKLEVVEFFDGALEDSYEASVMIKEQMLLCIGKNTGAMFDEAGEIIDGNATDKALLSFVTKENYEAVQGIKVFKSQQFNSANKYSAAELDGTTYYKGAPERLLSRAKYYLDHEGNVIPLDLAAINQKIDQLAEKSMRVLSFAYSNSPLVEDTLPTDLVIIGFVGIRDDVRPEARHAIGEVQQAGVQVVMITGDRKETAVAIAKDCGLMKKASDVALTSDELNQLSDETVKEMLPNIRVIARALPTDKSRMVRLAQELNLVCGMTGDGVNDAPALKRADVGFSMGSGTDVAKEVGDIVILDDNFKSIESAILYGRTIYNNIQKFIKFQLTINVAAVAICAIAPFLGMEQPLGVTHILWINLIMDGLGALALGSEPALKAYMNEKPKSRTESIVSRKMMGQILVAGTYVTILSLIFLTLPFFKQFFGSEDIHSTAYFSLFVLLAVFNAFNIRSEGPNLFVHMNQNPGFIKVMGMIVIVQIILTFVGGKMFSCTPMGLAHWALILVLAVSIIPVDLLRKTIVRVLHPKTQVSIVVEESPVSTASEADQKALEF
ncbi:cation-translocating P-type ATPase [Turicibacter bilis]|uniref:Cation-translocating P-type ATPase n=1 Tax=Turicibacter bilis TaxID=2735723 RepID=A0ABY5JHF4_9FIRM|nr:cation-translocating P-type ATPase [Turicibacter bilis]MBS3199511.1 cation-translocating P-type ATPase [Turicibacter bilis]UUF06122.1 cation-translocating P-type ATPase [Turicibacter bilis]